MTLGNRNIKTKESLGTCCGVNNDKEDLFIIEGGCKLKLKVNKNLREEKLKNRIKELYMIN